MPEKELCNKVLQDRKMHRESMTQEHLQSILHDLALEKNIDQLKGVSEKLQAYKKEYELMFNKNIAGMQLARLVHDIANYPKTPNPEDADAQDIFQMVADRIEIFYFKKNIAEIACQGDKRMSDDLELRVKEYEDTIPHSVTIDFDKVYKEVDKANDDMTLNAFHALYSLGSNVCIKALRDLRNALRDEVLSNEDIRGRFEKPLFDVLRDWAYSESGLRKDTPELRDGKQHWVKKIGEYEVYNKYQKMCAAQASEEAKVKDDATREFVNYCAELQTSFGGLWTHNHAEKIAAIALSGIRGSKSSKDILVLINEASIEYIKACGEQETRDISRDLILLDLYGRKVLIDNEKMLTQDAFRELTGAQIEFMRLACDQGKTLGAFAVITATPLRDESKGGMKDTVLSMTDDRIICLIKEGDNVYMIMTGFHAYNLDKKGGPLSDIIRKLHIMEGRSKYRLFMISPN